MAHLVQVGAGSGGMPVLDLVCRDPRITRLTLIEPDARHFGCVGEVSHAREILARGTSAHRQLAVFQRALSDGATHDEALAAVVDWLIAETVQGL